MGLFYPTSLVSYVLIHVYMLLVSGSLHDSMTDTGKPTNLWFEYSLLYLCL